MKELFKRQNIVFYVLYFIILLWSIWNDVHFFDFSYVASGSYYVPSGSPHSVLFYLSLKIVFAFLLYRFMAICKKYFFGGNQKDADSRRRLIFVFIILIVYLVFLIACWPGIWWCNGADEFRMVDFTKHLQVQYHQGFMMSLFYFLAFMIYPAPVSVVLLQMLVGSMIFGVVLADLWKERRRWASVAVIGLIFSPCGLYFALYPMRAYLTAVFFVAFIYKYWKLQYQETPAVSEWIQLALLGAIVINFRIEMMVVLVFFPLLMWKKAYSDKVKRWIWIVMLTLLMCMSVGMVSGWKKLGNQGNSVTHNLLSFTAPLSEILVWHFDEFEIEDMVLLDRYFDLNKMIEEHSNPENIISYANYERLTHPGDVVDSREYCEVKKIIGKILLSHPEVYLKNKSILAARTFGIIESGANRYQFPEEIKPQEVAGMFHQLNPELSEWIKDKLAGDFCFAGIFMFKILYAMWVPELLLLFDLIHDLMKKNTSNIILKIMILTIFGAVFLTAMHQYTMYYFTPFLGAWITVILSFSDKMRRMKNHGC